MKFFGLSLAALLLISACASPYDPLADYEEVKSTTILDAPASQAGTFAPEHRDQVERGEYLVELLGCGACHTEGALSGSPDEQRMLAGSMTGIAYTNPLEHRFPGVVFPSNITPDTDTGIGLLSDKQLADAIRSGVGRHAGRAIVVMPWQGYARLSQDDLTAIVVYLRSIKPVRNAIPDSVPPGTRTNHPYVHFGVYRSR